MTSPDGVAEPGPGVAPRGVIPVLETPFTASGDLDRDGFVRVLEHVATAGVNGVMFPGYASEVLKLSDRERHDLVVDLLTFTGTRPELTAVVSVPDHATKLAVERASWAAEEGADAINVLPPHLLGPPSSQVIDHLRQVLAAVFPVPVVVQYAPLQTGTTLTADNLAALAAEQPNLAAIKVESNPPGPMVSALARLRPSVPALVGYAGLHLPDAVRRGAVGVQPGSSFVQLYVELWRRWESGDDAGFDQLHRSVLPYLSAWMHNVEAIVQVEKTISRERGLIATDVCRAPGHPLDEHERAMLDRFLAEFGAWLPEAGALDKGAGT